MNSNIDDLQTLNFNKVAAMLSLTSAVAVFELLPLLIIRKGTDLGRSSNVWLDHLLRGGGGVLLATTYIHLLPEVRERVEVLQMQSIVPKWMEQLPELLMCLGFFMMYGFEIIVHLLIPEHNKEDVNNKSEKVGSNEKTHHIHVDSNKPFRGILLSLAVTMHEIFEGVAIGLEKSVGQVWTILGAVAAHKLVIAAFLGAEILSGGASFKLQVFCLGLFAVSSSIGIAVGMIMSSSSSGSVGIDLASAILQGIATGTLMFIVFFEVLVKSERHGKIEFTQYLATLVGFLVMLSLLLLLQC